MRHPAKFTDNLLPTMAEMLSECNGGKVLDPFAGTGKIALIKEYGFTGKVYANELEEEWISDNEYGCDYITVSDAEFLDYPDGFFDAICTSPTYGNRMADHHNAKDGSRRVTYTHCLGHPLNDGNTGKMQFGNAYISKHENIYKHLFPLVRGGGVFILNVKNFIKSGAEIDVVSFHKSALEEVGFVAEQDVVIQTPNMGFGKNRELRVDGEHIIKFRKPTERSEE